MKLLKSYKKMLTTLHIFFPLSFCVPHYVFFPLWQNLYCELHFVTFS